MKPVLLQFDDELVAGIDAARGDVPRTVWIRRACEMALPGASGEPTLRGMPLVGKADGDGSRVPLGSIKVRRQGNRIISKQRLVRYDGDREVWEEVAA